MRRPTGSHGTKDGPASPSKRESVRDRRWPPPLRAAVALAAAAFTVAAGAACAPDEGPVEEGAFVVLLGTDTVAVERYALSDHRMEVLAVTRSPRTLFREAVLEFDAAGEVTRYETQVRDPLQEGEASVVERTAVVFEEDSAAVESGVGEEVERSRVAAEGGMIPFSLNHFAFEDLAIRRALEADRDTIRFFADGPIAMAIGRPGPDAVVLESPQLGDWTARVDAEGRIEEMQAGALGRDVVRAPGLDVDSLARAYAEAEGRGEGMGPLSPRDTVEAQVHGATVTVDYSRPAMRGREVYGGLVPYDEVWRTGADLATHLETDRSLRLAGEEVPAGTYTVFTIPRPDEWTLILNRETGQAGTDHDPEEDLLRAPMETAGLEPPEERFTIVVEEEGDEGVLRLLWAETEARVPFRVEGVGGG